MKDIYIIGSGGFSKQVIEMIELINEQNLEYRIMGIIDDNEDRIGDSVLGYKIVGNTEVLKAISLKKTISAVIAIASGLVKENIASKLKKVEWVNLVHPNATISRRVSLGKGNIICAGVIINPECKIKDHNHINIGVTLGHDVMIENYVTIMPGVNISGNTILNNRVMIGTGAVVLQQLSLEKDVVLGAGAVLVKNAVKTGVYTGIPARINS